MQIKVNDRMIDIFAGARVRDVLRKYSKITLTQVQKGSKVICGSHCHEIGLDGELSAGAQLIVKRIQRTEPQP